VNPVGSADAKLVPAPRLLGVASDKIGVTSVAFACTHVQAALDAEHIFETGQCITYFRMRARIRR